MEADRSWVPRKMPDHTLVQLGDDDGSRGMIRSSGDGNEGIALIETTMGLLESTSANY